MIKYSPLFQNTIEPPLYNGHLSTTATYMSPTNGHFSTPAFFFSWRTVLTLNLVSTSLQLPFILADSPYTESCFNLFTTAIFLGGQSIHAFILVSTSLQLPFILADSPYTESCFRLSTMATSLQWPLFSVCKVAV